MRGVYPGSFDPLTVAHLAIAEAAVVACSLDHLDLVVSYRPLAKDGTAQTSVDDRLAAIDAQRLGRPWLGSWSTELRLLADIADGYDVLVVGADKWAQLHDPAFYDDTEHLRASLARLPHLVVAPRTGAELPAGAAVTILTLEPHLADVSSSAVRAGGRDDWRA